MCLRFCFRVSDTWHLTVVLSITSTDSSEISVCTSSEGASFGGSWLPRCIVGRVTDVVG